jgi:glycosyltransferase involved in cell wall biosynthesis
MDKSTVDIIVITYNQESLIEETLDSILNQTYDNINQIIVTDDGSIDRTPNMINEYAKDNPLIKPILAKKNKGIAYNINRGLKEIEAEYVSITGGDDLMHEHKIEKQVNYLNLNVDSVVCAHDMDVFNTNLEQSLGKFSDIISFKKIEGKVNVESIFDPSVFLCPSSFLYKSEIIPENGFDTRLKYLNDFVFSVDILMKGNLGFIDEVLGTYRIHGNNITSSEEAKMMGFEDALIAFSIILSRYPELYKLVKQRKVATYLDQILKSIKNGNDKKAKILSKVLMTDGSYFKGLLAYLLSIVLNKAIIDKIYGNRKLLKLFLKFI